MKALGVILIAVLAIAAIPASAADRTVAEELARMKFGRKIKMELNTGEILKGRMGAATAEQFNLEPNKPGQATTRAIRFDEVRSVSAGLSGKQKWALGVGIGVGGWLALMAAVLAAI